MLSYIYGRVGVENYSKSQMSDLLKLMNDKLISLSQQTMSGAMNCELSELDFKNFHKEFHSSKKMHKLQVIQKYLDEMR